MLWIALAFVVAMMVGFLSPRKPLKLNLNAPPKAPAPPTSPAPKSDVADRTQDLGADRTDEHPLERALA